MAYSPFNLSGKVALVTGGNGGIGLGMADAMARAGADIVIWGTNDEKNRAAAASLGQHGVRVHTRKVDVANEVAVAEAMHDAVAKMGRVDAVFANAGIGSPAR
ncbi:MAG: SDR family NAD(P)-dependent oxidoreductase, partial [Alphaproteobacteria bacterium]